MNYKLCAVAVPFRLTTCLILALLFWTILAPALAIAVHRGEWCRLFGKFHPFGSPRRIVFCY